MERTIEKDLLKKQMELLKKPQKDAERKEKTLQLIAIFLLGFLLIVGTIIEFRNQEIKALENKTMLFSTLLEELEQGNIHNILLRYPPYHWYLLRMFPDGNYSYYEVETSDGKKMISFAPRGYFGLAIINADGR